MHKIFAKTLFLGKKVVFLPQCHSTNDVLIELVRKSDEPEGLVLYTGDQTNGKGQRGNQWVAEPGKNILMSVLLRPKFLNPKHQFYLNLVAGLSIVDMIENVLNKDVLLKWPNDVYIDDKKIAGILIENNMRGNVLESSIVGIGLNVNQKGFYIHNATSLTLENGNSFDLLQLKENLLSKLEKWYLKLKCGQMEEILNAYHQRMMWRGEARSFRAGNMEFIGEIVGIDEHGRLAINRQGDLRYFGIKEVQFVG